MCSLTPHFIDRHVEKVELSIIIDEHNREEGNIDSGVLPHCTRVQFLYQLDSYNC